MSEIELLPCRWCDSIKAAVTWESGFCGVQCSTCGATGPQKSSESDATAAWNRRPPQVGRGMEEVVAFLLGSAPLDDVWFGDRHPTEKGAFWWRRHLRAALSVLPAEEGGSAAGAAPFASKRSTRSALNAELQDVLGEIEAFLQDQHDIRDGAGGQQLPNKAMALSTALKEALGERP